MVIQVKIIKCHGETFWYRNLIGQVFIIDSQPYPHFAIGRLIVDGVHKGSLLHAKDLDFSYGVRQIRKNKLSKIWG